jgi:hypothetical protein
MRLVPCNSVLECASPLALFHERAKSARGLAHSRTSRSAERLLEAVVRIGVILAMALSTGLSEASEPSASAGITFRPVHIFVHSGAAPLAAYQIEFGVTNGTARIVGVEGGEHPAFAKPPYYDPRAMQQERVIIAAFSTNSAASLPTGRTRVATVHLQVGGGVEPGVHLKLTAAADSGGNSIRASATIEQHASPGAVGNPDSGGGKQ